NMVFYADEWSDRSGPSWARVRGRLAGEDRLGHGLAAPGNRRHHFQLADAERGALAARLLRDANDPWPDAGLLSFRSPVCSQHGDGGIRGFLPTGGSCIGVIPFSGTRFVDWL